MGFFWEKFLTELTEFFQIYGIFDEEKQGSFK